MNKSHVLKMYEIYKSTRRKWLGNENCLLRIILVCTKTCKKKHDIFKFLFSFQNPIPEISL